MNSWDQMVASDVMHSPVTSVSDGVTLDEVVQLLTDERISGAPVIDPAGRPIGVVSLFDVAHFLAGVDRTLSRFGGFYLFDDTLEGWDAAEELGDRNLLEETVVEDIMNPEVFSVTTSTALPEVVGTMAERRIHRLLVMDEAGSLAGLISTMDVLALLRTATAAS